MKRIFISLLTVIACSMAAMAQDSRVATLQHGTNIKAYYGPDALVEAHKGAVATSSHSPQANSMQAKYQKPSPLEAKGWTRQRLYTVVT